MKLEVFDDDEAVAKAAAATIAADARAAVAARGRFIMAVSGGQDAMGHAARIGERRGPLERRACLPD